MYESKHHMGKKKTYTHVFQVISQYDSFVLALIACICSVIAIIHYFNSGQILLYGDSESHLNIAKRVVQSITPGFAQLGGIWLPLPHLLLIPFVASDVLWRTGVAGAIVSGSAFICSAVFLYKIVFLVFQKKLPAFICFLVFTLNPNILYLQSTPLTELPLLAFSLLSIYFFLNFLRNDKDVAALLLSGFFGFAASLCRYDGWFLVLFETAALIFFYFFIKKKKDFMEGYTILYSTVAFLGIGLWFLWDSLILGDPFYFTNSPFSAKSQQQGWLARGELPTYKHAALSFVYYLVTSVENIGIILSFVAITGFVLFIFDKTQRKQRFIIAIIFLIPCIFYVLTLYMGQSVIFLPDLTPKSYLWRLFNVRYGSMMVPFAAFFTGYLFLKVKAIGKLGIIVLLLVQLVSFWQGYEPILTLSDGMVGLSASKHPDAEKWMATHYDQGYVLLDDYARTVSIIRTKIPIQKVIYIGNKPYWNESFKAPEKYATWIIAQKNDAVWNGIYEQPPIHARLFKYFNKVYTSPTILIFKRNTAVK